MDFLTLAAQAFADPATTDFIALRQAYMASDHYNPTSHYSSGKLMGNTNSLPDMAAVAAFCEDVLAHNPMDLEARLLLEFALEQLDRHADAQRHHAFSKGMFSAIMASGNGTSQETAWHVVAVAEEYTLLSVLGIKPRGQQLVEADGRYYDVLAGEGRDGVVTQYYFDITAPFGYLRDMLE